MDESTITFLSRVGFSSSKILTMDSSTRLYHDLKEYGDSAEDTISELINLGVDMKGFRFEDYFPPEFVGDNVISRFFLSLLPIKMAVNGKAFKPFTLEMVSKLLASKSWRHLMLGTGEGLT